MPIVTKYPTITSGGVTNSNRAFTSDDLRFSMGPGTAVQFSGFGFAIPTNAVVTDIKVNIEGQNAANADSLWVELFDATDYSPYSQEGLNILLFAGSTDVTNSISYIAGLGNPPVYPVDLINSNNFSAGLFINDFGTIDIDSVSITVNYYVSTVTRSPATAAYGGAVSGSASGWSNPQNIYSSDNLRAIAGGLIVTPQNDTGWLNVSNFSFAIPSTATIDGIQAEIECNTSNGNMTVGPIRLMKAGSRIGNDLADGRTITTSESYQAWGGVENLWGTTWTPAEVNASNFGISFNCARHSGSSSAWPQVDHVRLTVYYTDPPAGGSSAALAGSASTTGSTSATLRVDRPLSGSASSTATATGALAATRPLSGSASATSAANGSIALAQNLTGTASSTTTVSGVLSISQPIAGSESASSMDTGTLFVPVPLSGSETSTCSDTGNLGTAQPLSGTETATSTDTSGLNVSQPLTASESGASTDTGSLLVSQPLSGNETATSSDSATITVTQPLIGQDSSTGSSSGTLSISTDGNPSGNATSTSIDTGSLFVSQPLTGSESATSTDTSSITVSQPISGADNSTSNDVAAITVYQLLAVNEFSNSSATGLLRIAQPLSGNASSISLETGSLALFLFLSGSENATGVTTGTISLLDLQNSPFTASSETPRISAFVTKNLTAYKNTHLTAPISRRLVAHV